MSILVFSRRKGNESTLQLQMKNLFIWPGLDWLSWLEKAFSWSARKLRNMSQDCPFLVLFRSASCLRFLPRRCRCPKPNRHPHNKTYGRSVPSEMFCGCNRRPWFSRSSIQKKYWTIGNRCSNEQDLPNRFFPRWKQNINCTFSGGIVSIVCTFSGGNLLIVCTFWGV